jgi:hypothetical protein
MPPVPPRARAAVTGSSIALALVLGACSSGSTSPGDAAPAETGQTSTSTTSGAPSTSGTPSPSGTPSTSGTPSPDSTITATGDAIFSMPSGRIGCIITEAEVRCDVMQPAFEPRPEDRYPCEYDLGHSMVIVDGRAKIGCISDSLVGSAVTDSDLTRWWTKDLGTVDGQAVLPYGRTLARGHLSCTSAPSGVTCSDARSGSSFELARERYELRP